MPEFCSCGARLPADARFCHKCGKPQFAVDALDVEPEQPPGPVVPPALPPPEINFHNRVAVRVGLLAAALASLLISFPVPGLLAVLWLLVWLVSAGFLAVYLYGRRTGQFLSVRSGARMGWITGIFCFAIATVFFTVSVITITSKGGLAQFYREQFSSRATGDVNLEQVIEVLESPAGLVGIILFTLILLFFLFTLLPTLGGALGAKVLEKE